MSSIMHSHRSANEKSLNDLQDDVSRWENLFHINSEEIRFLVQFLTSDIFELEVPDLYEKLQALYTEVEELKEEMVELQEEVRNHKNDLNGMRECEDISCETFYYSQHQQISDKLEIHIEKIQKTKMKIIRFSTPHLRKNKSSIN